MQEFLRGNVLVLFIYRIFWDVTDFSVYDLILVSCLLCLSLFMVLFLEFSGFFPILLLLLSKALAVLKKTFLRVRLLLLSGREEPR